MADQDITSAPEPQAAAQADAAAAGHGTLEFLLRRMRLKSDFPALSEAIQRINQLARSERERVDNVSRAILQDFSLTNKILRLANSSIYRTAGQDPVSTMSRAIMVLGLEAVCSLAVSLTLFEHMGDKSRAARLREEFVRASLRGSIARSISGEAGRHCEEAYLGAMFHRLGQLLALYYFPEEFDEIERLVNVEGVAEAPASKRVLGISYEQLGTGVAGIWGFPPTLVRCMGVIDAQASVPNSASQDTHLQVLANFSAELGDLFERNEPARLHGAIDELTRRYGKSLGTGERQIRATLDVAAGQMRELAKVLSLNLSQTQVGRRILGKHAHAPEEAAASPSGAHPGGGEPSATALAEPTGDGSPTPATATATDTAAASAAVQRKQEVLANGLVDLSRTLAEQSPLNDVIRLAVETLYRGMALQRVLFALRDARTNTLIGRMGFGPGMPEIARTFRIALDAAGDLFAATANKGADLLIHDSGADNIRDRIPDWHRQHFGAGSFILLPLALKGSPVGLIYADQAGANEITIGEQELSLVRAIRNQVVLAFRHARAG